MRLSDFLLWQTSRSVVYFTQTLWPDFRVSQLVAAVFKYQQRQYGVDGGGGVGAGAVKKTSTARKARAGLSARDTRVEKFAGWLKEQQRLTRQNNLVNC